jgi:hypothetical protein
MTDSQTTEPILPSDWAADAADEIKREIEWVAAWDGFRGTKLAKERIAAIIRQYFQRTEQSKECDDLYDFLDYVSQSPEDFEAWKLRGKPRRGQLA